MCGKSNKSYCGNVVNIAMTAMRSQFLQYGQHKDKRYVLANRIEALVYLAAHELRHLWQTAKTRDDRRSVNLPMAYGSRGKFSEVDTEAFAIHTLREYWRNRPQVP
jgi:hypothetical protein